MGKYKQQWGISEQLWHKVEPLIPPPPRKNACEYRRKPGAGRKPLPARQVFVAIVFVLRTGIQWKALPKEVFGSPSSIHRYFQQWHRAGLFVRLWQAGLAEYDDMQGIAWQWQSLDGAMCKAPLAQQKVGPNPTDRGKKWEQAQFAGGRAWHPVIARRQCSQRA
jgi:transposase